MLVVSAFALTTAAIASTITGALPKESVRAELIRRQSQTGLTLVAFYSGSLEVVSFVPRSLQKTGYRFPSLQEGVISPDGIDAVLLRDRPFTRFATARLDGTGLREYAGIAGGYRMCWNSDRSQILMSVEDNSDPFHTTLQIVDVGSKTARNIDSNAYVYLTPQCSSPDGKRFVYETQEPLHQKKDGSSEAVNPTLKIYDVEQNKSHELAKGSEPSWSPDGDRIAFLDDRTYYAIAPSGDGKTILFHKGGADSGLAWSPDSRLVAYTSHNTAFERPLLLDVGPVRLRVRRLSDNSEDWILQLTDAYLPLFQWVENKDLISHAQSQSSPQ